MIERLELKNFTVFDRLSLDFSPGINVFIGENGTGKTHILKIMYTILTGQNEFSIASKISANFLSKNNDIRHLVRKFKKDSQATVKIDTDKGVSLEVEFPIPNHAGKNSFLFGERGNIGAAEEEKNCVYIPVKEMLANAPGFLSTYNKRELHFEEVYADIISKAFLPKLKNPEQETIKLLKKIEKIMGGEVVQENEVFYLKGNEGKIEFTLLAEGMRKLALLWLLIQNGSLQEGVKLFWDEPEANLNPSLLKTVIEVLFELQRFGVQIFLATHNYIILKQLDILKEKNNSVRFFHLTKDKKTKAVNCQSGDSYTDLLPNKISDAYTDIYNAEVERSLGVISK